MLFFFLREFYYMLLINNNVRLANDLIVRWCSSRNETKRSRVRLLNKIIKWKKGIIIRYEAKANIYNNNNWGGAIMLHYFVYLHSYIFYATIVLLSLFRLIFKLFFDCTSSPLPTVLVCLSRILLLSRSLA